MNVLFTPRSNYYANDIFLSFFNLIVPLYK